VMYELFKAALPWIPPVLHRIRPSSRHQLPHPAASLLGAPFLRPPASRAAPRVAARVGKQEAAAIGEGGEETRIGRGGERRAGDWERVMIWDWGVIFDLGFHCPPTGLPREKGRREPAPRCVSRWRLPRTGWPSGHVASR
jgi:hypothetical protein